MPTRDDVMEELGLAPTWRIRVRGAGPAAEAPAATPPITAPAVDPRSARIAMLDWTMLADDIAA